MPSIPTKTSFHLIMYQLLTKKGDFTRPYELFYIITNLAVKIFPVPVMTRIT